jgi:HSP20 family protein
MFTRRVIGFPGFGTTNPFAEMERMRRQMDALADLVFRGRTARSPEGAGVFPLVNITESQQSYFLRAELPGMQAADLDIQVTGRNVTIAGERRIPSEGSNVKYHRSEREAGIFSRVVGLPGEVDADKAQASMHNGLLTITIPKSEAAKPRQISVK